MGGTSSSIILEMMGIPDIAAEYQSCVSRLVKDRKRILCLVEETCFLFFSSLLLPCHYDDKF